MPVVMRSNFAPPQLGRGPLGHTSDTNSFVVGRWTNVTPPGLGLDPHVFPSFGGIWVKQAPSNPNIVLCCIDSHGLYKSIDNCRSWSQVTAFPSDSAFSVHIDPSDANHWYVTNGVRGSAQGFWVTTDGGANFTVPAGFTGISGATNDVTWLNTAPNDFSNIALTSHSPWSGSGLSNNGILRSTDGGSTWVKRLPKTSWPSGTTPCNFLYDPATGQGDATTLLVGTDGDGMWKSIDDGVNWTQVSTTNIGHGGQTVCYASNGKCYIGAAGQPLVSSDNGDTWTAVTGLPSFYYYTVFKANGYLYSGPSFTGDMGDINRTTPLYRSLETDGVTWTEDFGSQQFTDGPLQSSYDPTTGVLLASFWGAGIQGTRLF